MHYLQGTYIQGASLPRGGDGMSYCQQGVLHQCGAVVASGQCGVVAMSVGWRERSGMFIGIVIVIVRGLQVQEVVYAGVHWEDEG